MPRNDFDLASVTPDGRAPSRARLFTPDGTNPWRGNVEGQTMNGACTVLAYGNDTVGLGPRLHVHPYDETFIVVAGRARFFVGDQVIDAEAGDVVFGPKGLPREVVDKINSATRKALEDPSVRKRIEDTGSVVLGNTPEQFAVQLKDELAVYRKVVETAKLKLD